MKKQILFSSLFILLCISFFSCQKGIDDGTVNGSGGTSAGYYIRGKKDGTSFNFTSNAQAKIFDAGSGVTLLSMIAGSGSLEGFNLGINFFNGTSITTGTYREDNQGTDYVVAGVYNPNSTTIVYGAGIQVSAKPLVINILTKTSTEISGTFEGAFYKQDLNGTFFTDYITITQGEFKLPIK